MKKSGFTLVELLAVIVIIAIIMVMAVPQVFNTISDATKNAFQSDAKLVINTIENKKIVDSGLDITSINEDNIQNVLGLSANNYETIDVIKNDDKVNVFIIGKNKWAGLTAYGSFNNINVVEDTDTGSSLLSNLTVSTGTLAPAFNTNTFNYQLTLTAGTTSVDLIPTLQDSSALININGSLHTNTSAYTYTFASGETSATINVKVNSATKGESITYVFNVTIGPNTNLSSLALTGGHLISPSFNSTQTSYTASVPYSTSNISVALAPADSNATVRVNGVVVLGTSQAINLTAGDTTQIFIRVSNGGTNKDYTIDVTRAAS